MILKELIFNSFYFKSVCGTDVLRVGVLKELISNGFYFKSVW